MKTRAFGKTRLQVSEVGFGGWPIGGNAFGNSYGTTDDAVSLAALNKAYDLGCTFFETADHYGHGHSETLIGQALKGWERDRVMLATKGGQDFSGRSLKMNFSEAHLRAAVEGSLQRLGADTLDLYQLDFPPVELIQHARVFEVLRALQREGKIRHYGVSIRDPQEGIQAITLGGAQAVQIAYNLFDRRAEKALFDVCQQHGTALIIREPLARGFLGGKFTPNTTFEPGDARAAWPKPFVARRIQAAEAFRQAVPSAYPDLASLALKFALHPSAVSVIIPGCKTPVQAEANMRASKLPDLSKTDLAAIDQVYASIFGAMP